jgi:hypothetical protein
VIDGRALDAAPARARRWFGLGLGGHWCPP